MSWSNWPDGEKMKTVRSKINALGDLFAGAIAPGLTHDQTTWNNGANTEPRLISPDALKTALGSIPPNSLSMPVAVGVFSRPASTLNVSQSFGVDSVSVGSSYFTVNLARPMASANYPIILNARAEDITNGGANDNSGNLFADIVTASSFRIYFLNRTGDYMITDVERVSFMVFGNVA